MKEDSANEFLSNPRFDGLDTNGLKFFSGTLMDKDTVPATMFFRSAKVAPFMTGNGDEPPEKRSYDSGFGLALLIHGEDPSPDSDTTYSVSLLLEDPTAVLRELLGEVLTPILSEEGIHAAMSMIISMAAIERQAGTDPFLVTALKEKGLWHEEVQPE